MRTKLIYPGGNIFLKRIGYSVTACCIVLNVYIQKLESLIFNFTAQMVSDVSLILPSEATAERIFDPTILAIEKIENTRFNWVVEQFGIPSSAELKEKSTTVKSFAKTCQSLKPVLEYTGTILKWIGYLGWIPILWACLWLLIDLRKGNAKLITSICLVFVLLANIESWKTLSSFWNTIANI